MGVLNKQTTKYEMLKQCLELYLSFFYYENHSKYLLYDRYGTLKNTISLNNIILNNTDQINFKEKI